MPARRWRRALLRSFLLPVLVQAQYSGGQFFTKGLAIISSPQPNAQNNAGGDLSAAISLSGQGNLTDFTPGSSDGNVDAGYDNLELFLISAPNNINLTVSTDFLTQEPGSNVKHPKFTIPTCIPAGSYNLTLYETSRFSSNPLFVITSVPLTINNNKPSGQCTSNPVLGQPQVDAPLSGSPWIVGKSSVSKLALSTATLASTDSQVFAASPPQGGSSSDQDSSSTTTNESNTAAAQPPAQTSGASISISTSTVLVSSDGPEPTQNGQNGQGNSGSGGVGSGSVLVQTITVTTNVAVATGSSDLNGAGILFPINGAQSISALRTALFPLLVVFILTFRP